MMFHCPSFKSDVVPDFPADLADLLADFAERCFKICEICYISNYLREIFQIETLLISETPQFIDTFSVHFNQ